MEPGLTADGLVRELAAHQRVVVLGGRAMVYHGHGQPVNDFDVWLDPALELEEWCETLWHLADGCDGISWVCPTNWLPVSRDEIARCVATVGMVRLSGPDPMLDVIRQPNCPRTPVFDKVWSRAMPVGDGTRMPMAVDLLRTIPESEREIYRREFAFLELKIEEEYRQTLLVVDEGTALRMLERYISPEVARTGGRHDSFGVREFCFRYLLEQSDSGNPFATDILMDWR